MRTRALLAALAAASAVLGVVLGVTGTAQATTEDSGAGELTSVSCPTDTFCMAVGFRYAGDRSVEASTLSGLAYRYDGSSDSAGWTAMPTLDPPSGYRSIRLDSVSCTSANRCTALGFARTGLNGTGRQTIIAEQWNGTAWHFLGWQYPGDVSKLVVSCSGTISCMAIGQRGTEQNISVTWQLYGSTFQLRPPAKRPFPKTYLEDISCVSPTNCTAVGTETQSDHTLAERWNGHVWTYDPSITKPHPRTPVFAVSCPAERSCVAVGIDGSSQSAVFNKDSDNPWRYGVIQNHLDYESGGIQPLYAISCDVFHRCAAVGQYRDRGGQAYEYTDWRDFQTGGFVNTTKQGDVPYFFNDVACRANGCVYVGSDVADNEFDNAPRAHHPVIYRGRADPIRQTIPAPPPMS